VRVGVKLRLIEASHDGQQGIISLGYGRRHDVLNQGWKG
jgi:hypothetical protein